MNRLEKFHNSKKITIKGKSVLVETDCGKYVIKKSSNKNLKDLFCYLKSRGFDNYPEIYSSNRDDEYICSYIEDREIYNPSKSEDLINLVAILHAKTSYQKEVTEETYREIYENIQNNIMYLNNYYERIYESLLKEIYSSPSHYEFLRNYSKIKAALNFSKEELDKWYDLVKEKRSERVSLIHNNLSLDHYLRNDQDYLISWDNAKFDTPVLDLYKLYQNNYFELEFQNLYEKYKSINELSEREEKLFFILISLVPEIEFKGTEFEKCQRLRKDLDYIYKTEEFLKPHYTTNTDDK